MTVVLHCSNKAVIVIAAECLSDDKIRGVDAVNFSGGFETSNAGVKYSLLALIFIFYFYLFLLIFRMARPPVTFYTLLGRPACSWILFLRLSSIS